MDTRKDSFLRYAGAVAIFAIIFGGLCWLLDVVLGFNPGAAILNAGHWAIAGFAPWKLPLIAIGVGVIAAIITGASSKDEDKVTMIGVVALVGVVAASCFSISTINRWGHDVAHEQINRVLVTEQGAAPEYEGRDPYDLAHARLQRSVGDSSGFSVPKANVWRFEVDGEPMTCGLKLAVKNEWKRPMSGVACVDDKGRVTEAEFEGNSVPTWKVKAGHLRLAQHVNDAFARGRFVESDVYGYIDSDGPHMVVPVTRMQGGLGWHEGWVGALVFDGDGTSRTVLDPSELPGPAIGESTADRVLNALNNRGGFIQSKQAETGFDLGEGENVTHFLLERADGSGERLVTLLTPRGSSETVTAVLEIDPHTVTNGWPTATLYRLPTRTEDGMSRASVAEALDLVRQRYGTAMQLSESRHDIMEATPGQNDELIVTVGSTQRVFSRVSVDMMTRETCVYTPAGVEVKCDDADAAPLQLGSLRGLFSSDDAPSPDKGEGAAEVPVTELSELSDVELSELLRQLADELDARRAVTETPVEG